MVKIVPNIDLLYEAVAERGHVCLGLDTRTDYLPAGVRRNFSNDAEAVLAYNKALVDATCDIAACYKVQIAYYEEMGLPGLAAYSETLKYIRKKKMLVIADIKRGDIADTAKWYAKAHFSGDFKADFVTLNPYLGMDSIEPWLSQAQQAGQGAFVLVRTSNPGMKDFQNLELAKGKRLYHEVADKLALLAQNNKGRYGYGVFGAVVGCTEAEKNIRADYPNLFFLIPGYGAQSGSAKDAALLLREGNGGVVNASRSIITAWQKETSDSVDNNFAAEAARRAAVKMRDDIRAAIS